METSNCITDDLKSMINNETFSDIVLKFESEQKSLYAHKLILSARSIVFSKMFTGPLATTITSISINECSYDSFLQILHYCYTDKLELDRHSVSGIMAAAIYYEIKNLEELCCDFVLGYLCVDNVCDIYEASSLVTNKLTVACLEMIDSNVKQIIDRGYFYHLKKSTIETILGRDLLTIGEFDLLAAVAEWITQNNESWDKLWNLIRFPTMTTSEFSYCCRSLSTMFECEQIQDIQRYIETGRAPQEGLPFSTVERGNYGKGILQFYSMHKRFIFYRKDLDAMHSVEVVVKEMTQITRIEFVESKNHLPDSIIYGIELSDEDDFKSLYENETSKPYIHSGDGYIFTLMPNTRYVLTTWIVWNSERIGRDKDDFCEFSMPEVLICHEIDDDVDPLDDFSDPVFRMFYNGHFETFVSRMMYKVPK